MGIIKAVNLIFDYIRHDEEEGGKEYCVNAKTQYVILKQYL